MPITVLDLALHRGATADEDGSINGAEFERVGLPICGGCERCEASIAAYNAFPSRPDSSGAEIVSAFWDGMIARRPIETFLNDNCPASAGPCLTAFAAYRDLSQASSGQSHVAIGEGRTRKREKANDAQETPMARRRRRIRRSVSREVGRAYLDALYRFSARQLHFPERRDP